MLPSYHPSYILRPRGASEPGCNPVHPSLQPNALQPAAVLPSYHPSQALAELPKAVAMGLLPSSLLDTALYRVLLQQLKLGVYDPHDGRCAWPLAGPCVASPACGRCLDPC